MMRRVYMDHAATTPLDPAVLDAMLPFLKSEFGNPSALYAEGRRVRSALDEARDQVARAIGAKDSGEIIFTASGTEANNLALRGVLTEARRSGAGDHLVVSGIEHQSVLETAKALADEGFRVTYVPPGPDGIVAPQRVLQSVTSGTVLVSVMLANNETGTLQPVAAIADACKGRGILVHTDAVQAAGQVPVDVEALRVDLLSLSAHKLYGPKGTGALYVRKGTSLRPQMTGGGQELERRAGTENVAGIVGLAKAIDLAVQTMEERTKRLRVLSDMFLSEVMRRIPDVTLNGHATERLPGVVNLAFPGVDGESLLLNLDMHGVAASTGSACAAGSVEPSHVLTAMGFADRARSSLRFSFGRDTTADDVEYVVDVLERLVKRLRKG